MMDSKSHVVFVLLVLNMVEVFLTEDVIDVEVNVSNDGKYATIVIVLKLKDD